MISQIGTRSKTSIMALCGLFAALSAICSWISIPLGFTPVPVNLATLAVFLSGALLGPKYGSLSLTVYALIGAVGAPVFAGFRGGFSVLAGPTGGYIVGYIAAAFVCGALVVLLTKKESTETANIESAVQTNSIRINLRLSAVYAFSMLTGLAVCYGLGSCWFMISTNTGFAATMVSCVIPFLPGDALKIAAATLLVQKIRKFI